MSYIDTIAVAIDQFAAAVFFNRQDMTISAMCRVVQLSDANTGNWSWRLTYYLKLNWLQILALRIVGKALDFTFKGHCEGARRAGYSRASAAARLLAD